MSPGGVAGGRGAVSWGASWSASRSSSAGSVGAAATKTVACGPVSTGPEVRPVDTVVGDAAAGLAVVFVVAGRAVVVELPAGAAVVVGAAATVVVGDSATAAGAGPLFPFAAPPHAAGNVRT